MRFVACLVVALCACGETKAPLAPDGGGGSDAPPAGDCAPGDACTTDLGPGLCSAGGVCGECLDPGDDAKCVAAYGAGTLCIQGECVAATCHSSADCGGKSCVDHQCTGCTTDDECDAGQVCNAGVCGDAANACSGKSEGAACGATGGDLCCQRQAGLSCVDVECCSDAQCATGESCEGGSCVAQSSGCVAPTTATYLVDPAYTGPSTGTAACPFKTLHGAFARVRNDDFDGDSNVVVVGGATIDATSEGGADKFPLTVPASVFVRTQAGQTDAKVVAPANTTALVAPFGAQAAATQPFAARISHLVIEQATPGTAGAGVLVTGGSAAKPVHVDHVEIRKFGNGINVDGGKAQLLFGVDVHDNAEAGLRVAAGRVEITVGANADARTVFHANKVGIAVTSDPASVLIANGSEDAQGLDRIAANNNSDAGIRIASPNAANALSHVGANSNGTAGIVIFGGSKVSLRSARAKQNGTSGIRIAPNGSVVAVAGIDLGSDASAGKNELAGNPDGDLCITADDTAPVLAAGNLWGGLDCSLAAGGSVPFHAGCGGAGTGVGYTGSFAIPAIVSHCRLGSGN